MLALVGASVAFGHRRPVSLPRPAGPHAVGRTIRSIFVKADSDATRGPRELVLWSWYPASPNSDASHANYLPIPWRSALEAHRGSLLNTVLNRDLTRVTAHSLDGAPPVVSSQLLPLVVLRAGLAAPMVDYSSMAEYLASFGYVVVGFDVPGRTTVVVQQDGTVATRPPEADPERLRGDALSRAIDELIDDWAADIALVVDHLARPAGWEPRLGGRVDVARVAVVGHSLGGATAAEFCRRDSRCAIGADLDGALGSRVRLEGLRRPFAFVLSNRAPTGDPESAAIAGAIQSVYDRLAPEHRLRVTVRGANHFSFSDQMVVRNPVPLTLLRWLGIVRLDPHRGLEVSAEVVRRLLDASLQQEGDALLPTVDLKGIPEIVSP